MPAASKNLKVALPGDLYAELRALARRSGRTATQIARDAIARCISEARRSERRRGIACYANDVAGTEADLDEALERAATSELRRVTKKRKRRR